jgi:hypothetical protein
MFSETGAHDRNQEETMEKEIGGVAHTTIRKRGMDGKKGEQT